MHFQSAYSKLVYGCQYLTSSYHHDQCQGNQRICMAQRSSQHGTSYAAGLEHNSAIYLRFTGKSPAISLIYYTTVTYTGTVWQTKVLTKPSAAECDDAFRLVEAVAALPAPREALF